MILRLQQVHTCVPNIIETKVIALSAERMICVKNKYKNTFIRLSTRLYACFYFYFPQTAQVTNPNPTVIHLIMFLCFCVDCQHVCTHVSVFISNKLHKWLQRFYHHEIINEEEHVLFCLFSHVSSPNLVLLVLHSLMFDTSIHSVFRKGVHMLVFWMWNIMIARSDCGTLHVNDAVMTSTTTVWNVNIILCFIIY